MPELVDLRSDTVTKPSPGMRQAMAAAEVGDDVFHEDPSVNRLEEIVAALYGKEAALYVASGTMANQIAIRAQTHHGDEIIMERTSHPFNSEAGALAALAGVQVNLIDGQHGIMDVEQIRPVVRTPMCIMPLPPLSAWKTPTIAAVVVSGHWRISAPFANSLVPSACHCTSTGHDS